MNFWKNNRSVILQTTTAFVVALGMWVAVALSQNYRVNVRIPLHISLPKGYAFSKPILKFLSVSMQSKGWEAVPFLMPEKLECLVKLNLKQIQNGNYKIPIKLLIEGLNISETKKKQITIEPEEIPVFCEKLATKTVPVIPKINLLPRTGFTITSELSLTPDSVQITGAENLIKMAKSCETEEIILDDIYKDINLQAPVISHIEGVSILPKVVRFSQSIQQTAEITLSNIELKPSDKISDSLGKLILFPNKIAVIVRGGAEDLANLNKEQFTATYNYLMLKHGNGYFKPIIKAPQRMLPIRTIPDKINYIFRKKEN